MSLVIGFLVGIAVVGVVFLKWFIGWYFNDGSDQ